MPFTYSRTIHFRDTDAAGVVYFANVLNLCHEAYEASLAAAGINLRVFFGGDAIAVPILHASVDFRQPLFCGDRITIHLQAQPLSASEFELHYDLFPAEGKQRSLSQAVTRHVCILAAERKRTDIPQHLQQWLDQLLQS